MREVEVALDDELFQQLDDCASQLGVRLNEFLAMTLAKRRRDFILGMHKRWMPLNEWEALVRGEGCALCLEIELNQKSNAYGYTVADLGLSRLRLVANQFTPGYCILICKRHVREPYHLTLEERSIYFEDMMRSANALEKAFKPVKMNFEILGNAIPHLHCHIKPRFYGDAAPGAPLHPDENLIELTPHEYEERVSLIRSMLEFTSM